MKKLKLNGYALILGIATLSLLGAGSSSALAAAACDNIWQEGFGTPPDTNYFYLDASYGDYRHTTPLVIKIDGDATEFQAFFVGDTVTITSHVHAVAESCAGAFQEAFSIATLEVDGPSGSSSDTTGILDIWNNGEECVSVNHEETLSISYDLTGLGEHTVSMNSNAQVAQRGFGNDFDASNTCTADLGLVVVDPLTGVGECISTLIAGACDGLKGSDRGLCAKDQIGLCHSLFEVPSAHN